MALLGFAFIAIAALSVAALAVGVGGWLTISFAPQSGARPTIAFAAPLDRLEWNARHNIGRTAQLALIASMSLPETRRPPQVSGPVTTLAIAEPDPTETPAIQSADPDITGSLGKPSSEPAPIKPRPAVAAKLVSMHEDASVLPLPKPRPHLAALMLKKDFSREWEEDARAPKTAIYDISAKTVYMPSGERLEAHSGFGDLMDDSRYVHRRMRGATPPNTYKLRLRESLFHGVQAIRMTPMNAGKMFGRDGILAHSYLLGPNGQSNGCVSFRDYPRFLQAFMRGEVDRMVVVTSLDRPPTTVARRDVHSADNTF